MINESLRLNKEGKESWLAIETSGHAALKENHFLDDGAYLVAKLLIKMARLKKENRALSGLIATLPAPVESREFRLPILTEDFKSYGNKVIEALQTKAEIEEGWSIEKPNFEGIRVQCKNPSENGWFLLRLSLHDPLMPLNIESETLGGVSAIASRLLKLLEDFENLEPNSML